MFELLRLMQIHPQPEVAILPFKREQEPEFGAGNWFGTQPLMFIHRHIKFIKSQRCEPLTEPCLEDPDKMAQNHVCTENLVTPQT